MAAAAQPIRFDDGDAYQRGMGAWSHLAGQVFLDWLAHPRGLRWIDVGCGNGALTELVVQRCAPVEMQGIDPSEAQLDYARLRPGARGTEFTLGDALALPFEAHRFDAAVMGLVIYFLPDPAQGVAEMVRVVRPGGVVATYAWDLLGGGFPFEPIRDAMEALGVALPYPPSREASRMADLHDLWRAAGLEALETREIAVERGFADFAAFWGACTTLGTVSPVLANMAASDVERLQQGLRARLSTDGGPISCRGRANAIKGRVPAARSTA
jgi:SAM-dependent methyltransferase